MFKVDENGTGEFLGTMVMNVPSGDAMPMDSGTTSNSSPAFTLC